MHGLLHILFPAGCAPPLGRQIMLSSAGHVKSTAEVRAPFHSPERHWLTRRPLVFARPDEFPPRLRSDANAVVTIFSHVHTNQLKSRDGESAELGLRRYIGECL